MVKHGLLSPHSKLLPPHHAEGAGSSMPLHVVTTASTAADGGRPGSTLSMSTFPPSPPIPYIQLFHTNRFYGYEIGA